MSAESDRSLAIFRALGVTAKAAQEAARAAAVAELESWLAYWAAPKGTEARKVRQAAWMVACQESQRTLRESDSLNRQYEVAFGDFHKSAVATRKLTEV